MQEGNGFPRPLFLDHKRPDFTNEIILGNPMLYQSDHYIGP